ncbi:hypothetical protein HF521_001878 [Silurus meridionalis]|uniref:Immunoglobulin domain-containing protein n=1 Tax=Silurus meridionalis TaxID=175797 RepID=A0A8T0BB07_SILME|nr:hypothetical protein HF521_001878 [Silurus meridionalis]
MEFYQLFFFLLLINMHTFPADASLYPTLTVIPNQNTTMRCNIMGKEEVAWYLLTSSDDFTLLISAEKARTRKILPVHYNKDEKRFILEPDSEVNTAIFTIINITPDDLGLYFCGTKPEFKYQMNFIKVIRLQFKENKEELITCVENKGEASWCEVALMFGGVGAAALLLLLTTVVACTVIRRS